MDNNLFEIGTIQTRATLSSWDTLQIDIKPSCCKEGKNHADTFMNDLEFKGILKPRCS